MFMNRARVFLQADLLKISFSAQNSSNKTKLRGQSQKIYKMCVESGKNQTGKAAKKLMTLNC
jgi:hypothetical protein